MTTEFKKYSSIENSYREEFIERIKRGCYGGLKYCITEKVHGANLQMTFDGKEFKIGTRTAYIEADQKFYNAFQVMEPIKPKLEKLFYHLKETYYKDLEKIILFGEIFGGSYPHKDVPKDNHASKVQKGVFYSPSNQFLAFDIMYKLAKADDSYAYFSYEEFETFCNTFEIPKVPILGLVKNLTEALNFPNDKPSVVYQMYDLPRIEDNIMEGVVIRPYFPDIYIGQHRLIIKNKNEKFQEKAKEEKKQSSPGNSLSDEHKAILDEMLQYNNENRVRNVISHLGEITIKDLGKIIGLTNRDIIEEYNKNTGKLTILAKEDEKRITKILNTQVSKTVKEIILNEY